MKTEVITIIAVATVVSVLVYGELNFETSYAEKQGSMMSMTDMCKTMMNTIPKDVVMTTISAQKIPLGEESSIVLLVTDKNTGKPADDAVVILHIEEGAPIASMENMNMMDMMGRMFEAENIGDGKFVVKFTPEKEGYYTMHTHAIPSGKSMMAMMNNHMDIGLISAIQ